MKIVFFQYAKRALELSQPIDIAVLDELGQGDIDLVKRCFKALDGPAPGTAEVFLPGHRCEKVDDIGRVLTFFGNLKNSDQRSEVAFGDVFSFVLKRFDERLDGAAVGDQNLSNVLF